MAELSLVQGTTLRTHCICGFSQLDHIENRPWVCSDFNPDMSPPVRTCQCGFWSDRHPTPTCERYAPPDNSFDTGNTDNIICPHCGYEDRDSWEVFTGSRDSGDIECGRCGKEFWAERIVSVSYNSRKSLTRD